MFSIMSNKTKERTIEMILDHDGIAWQVFHEDVKVSAASLDELDRKLEKELASILSREGKVDVLMTCNNEMIPEWMQPYMNHYFNRIFELPLK